MATPFTQRTDYVADAQAALTDQFKRDTVIKLGAALAKQVQDLENTIFAVLNGRTIDGAVGVQLDGLGALVGETRKGRTDALYRIRIKARIRLNLSCGTPEQILEIVTLLLPTGSQAPAIAEYFPASFIVTSFAALTLADAQEISAIIKLAKPAGVGSRFNYSLAAAADTFAFSVTASSVTDTARGFSDLTQVAGGKLAGVI